MKATTPNPIDVVELGYDLQATNTEWLHAVARAVRPLLEGHRGLLAYYYDARTSNDTWLAEALMFDLPAGALDAMRLMMQNVTQPDIDSMHALPVPLEGFLQAVRLSGIADPRPEPAFQACFETLDCRDVFALRTIEPGGKGIVLAAPQRDDAHVDRRSQRLWAKVSAHLAAGRRLRERLAGEPFEAVLTPGGTLEHAEGDSKSASIREALRTAVLRQEKARGKTRRDDPEAATDMWPALVSGRWSLVDHFERGGRRYIVARRNEHGGTDPRALGDRERAVAQLAALGKSNKLIAYELGVSESTVGSQLASAMRKLRVKTRVELLRLIMQMPPA